MATINGSTGRNASHWRYYLVCTEQNVDVGSNTSRLKVEVFLGATSYSRAVRGNITATHTINVNGTNYTFNTGAYTIEKNTNVKLGEITTNNIQHNADGTKIVSVSASSPDLAQASGYGPYSGSASGTVTLTTIPRASSITCADGNIGSATTININRASASFTHTLKYNFNDLTGTIVSKTANISVGWTIPISFYTKIPNSKSGQGKITCETYNGNILIGTSECNFNALVLEANNKPNIDATIVDVNTTTKTLTGDENKLVKYFSNAKVTITATAKNSASIKSKKVICGGKSKETDISNIENVESGTFDISCIDSRGFTTSKTITKTLVNYIKLAITSLTIERETSTSNTVKINCKGNYFNTSFGSVANTLALKWRYKLKNGNWSGYTTVTATKSGNTFNYNGTLGTNFDYQQAYEFEVVAQDKLITNTIVKEVTAGIPLVDIWKNNVKVNGNFIANQLKGNADTASKINTRGTITAEAGTTKPPGGLSFQNSYNNGYPHQFGNVLNLNGGGASQLFMGWEGSRIRGALFYRSMRDYTGDGTSWSPWGRIPSTTELYNNTSGSNGTITLSESAANFDYLEIHYFSDLNNDYGSVKIGTPNREKI